ncbi:MAG: hypothetical protein DMF82_14915 [Acidobacteria bacterium]|nr:MAG: hypothetical protein DMF82_14915 [Acidobacteriota bacterium]
MKGNGWRSKLDRVHGLPRLSAVEEWSRRGISPTALAAEALRTGVPPVEPDGRQAKIPGEDETIRVGDPDDDTLGNEYVGEETPGGSTPTPDQSGIDDIGRAYGLQGDPHAARPPSLRADPPAHPPALAARPSGRMNRLLRRERSARAAERLR